MRDFFFSCALEIQLLNSWLLDKRCCSYNGKSTRWTLHIQHTQKNSFTFVSQSSHTVKMPHQLFEKKKRTFSLWIFTMALFATLRWLAATRAAIDAMPLPFWLNIESVCVFFTLTFHLPFMCFCYFLLCGKCLQKTLNKTHCYCFKLHFATVIQSFVWISVYQVSI